mgnify:CR=1 FL=1
MRVHTSSARYARVRPANPRLQANGYKSAKDRLALPHRSLLRAASTSCVVATTNLPCASDLRARPVEHLLLSVDFLQAPSIQLSFRGGLPSLPKIGRAHV